MRIALLDDDPNQSDLICQTLSGGGHICHSFESGKALLEHLRREGCDMLVINWQIADASGIEVLRWVREKLPAELPVLFMTGRSDGNNIAAALTAGANDYLIKPVRRGELLTRIQVLLRRAYPTQTAPEEIRFAQYVFETRASRVTIDGNPIDVTQKEFDLALLFFRNLGRPLSRPYILEAIWSHESDVPSRTMDTHVSRVRNKLQLKPENGFRLTPVYSYGYQLEQLSK